jgi:hypothetical protein
MRARGIAISLIAVALAAAAPALAQTPPTPAADAILLPDHSMRAGKLIGMTVYNAQQQAIGTVVDILISGKGKEAKAVLSVGAFVGGGAKLVAVPLNTIHLEGDKAVMARATRERLARMPIFLFPPSQSGSG